MFSLLLCLTFTVHQDRLLLGLRVLVFSVYSGCGPDGQSWALPNQLILCCQGFVNTSGASCVAFHGGCPCNPLELLIFEDKFRGFCARFFFFLLLCFSEVETVNSLIVLSPACIYTVLCLLIPIFFLPFHHWELQLSIRDTVTGRAYCLWVLFPIVVFSAYILLRELQLA